MKHISEFGLSVKTYNVLMRAGLDTDEKVFEAIDTYQICKVRNLGRKSLEEIMEKVKKEGGENESK